MLYGKPSQYEHSKDDNIELPAELGYCISSQYFLNDKLLLQWPGWRTIQESDLIILVNANRNLLNIPMLTLSRMGFKRVALWGHGKNHQNCKSTLRERFKKSLALWPSWWFAYTEATSRHLLDLGFDSHHLTIINNSIDTVGFTAQVDAVSPLMMEKMRAQLNLTSSNRIVIYCGSLYPQKRISEMLEAAKIVAMRVPEFRLIVLGGGPSEVLIKNSLEDYKFLRYAGTLFGEKKAVCYRLSEFVLNPGLVGLGILDAFAAGRPLLTFADSLHSPEVAYLDHQKNGLIIDGSVTNMAEVICNLLGDRHLLEDLSNGAKKSGAEYSIEDMVGRVREGILECLNIC